MEDEKNNEIGKNPSPETPIDNDFYKSEENGSDKDHNQLLSDSNIQQDSNPKDKLFIEIDCFKQVVENIEKINNMEQCLFKEVREMHKLYHNEYAGRLRSMQEELENYRNIEKGRAYDDILTSIARIYDNNETLADEVSEPKAKKNIQYMLMDIEDLLGLYGMSKLRSKPGDKRNPRHCQILGRIPTDDPQKHDTVAKSYNSGFYIGNRTVIKEIVDIYVYESVEPVTEVEENQIVEADDHQTITD